jgi:hypothetical protein
VIGRKLLWLRVKRAKGAHRRNIQFAQLALDDALHHLENLVNDQLGAGVPVLEIRIEGGDLRREGVTRKQQLRHFDERARTVAELLTYLVIRAHPAAGVTDPSDARHQLVWVPLPRTDRQVILITTRRAAAANGYHIPTVFRGP